MPHPGHHQGQVHTAEDRNRVGGEGEMGDGRERRRETWEEDTIPRSRLCDAHYFGVVTCDLGRLRYASG